MSQLTKLFDRELVWFAEKASLSALESSKIEELLCGSILSDAIESGSRMQTEPCESPSTETPAGAPTKTPTRARINFGIQDLDSESGGLALGALHEFLYGAKKTDFPPYTIMALLASKALTEDEKYIFWIGSELKPSPFVLQKIPIKNFLKRNIFIAPPDRKSLFWATETALRSEAAGAVISHIDRYSISVSKRFALAAEKSGALGIVTATTKLNTNSAAKTRWFVSGAPSPSSQERFQISLLRNKGAKPAQNSWIIEVRDGSYNGDNGRENYGSDSALSLHLPGDVQHGGLAQDGLLGSKIYASSGG